MQEKGENDEYKMEKRNRKKISIKMKKENEKIEGERGKEEYKIAGERGKGGV